MKKEIIKDLTDFIKNYVKNANSNGIIIGMSGGKDSFIVAKLCTEAIGKENVLGIIMPNGEMCDINDAVACCECLGIQYFTLNINNIYNNEIDLISSVIKKKGKELNSITTYNTPPRLRMTTLYAIAGSLNYLVANTSNLSEICIGYTTKWGDNVGDFAPIANFTKTEVCQIGELLGLPNNLVNKVPSDGLSGKTDEDKLGIKYTNLDSFIRTGKENDDVNTILQLNKKTAHKRGKIPSYQNDLPNYLLKE